ncbi:hypothetical protein LS73_002485 [Helicobacter muridarum]|uniref:Uncharacterized protein n=1 Tax=Helicobacter muridarum TaxID=216 RepID=A0A4U8TN04_9HELI|nr:hypothetical protein [Helicobacter muridarum]TLE01159.1 hypothetical protein LS73_002485 [Helicobacter muridarum]
MLLDEIPEKCKYFDDHGILVMDNYYITSDYKRKMLCLLEPFKWNLRKGGIRFLVSNNMTQ